MVAIAAKIAGSQGSSAALTPAAIAAAGGLIGQTAVLQADFPKTNQTFSVVTGWSTTVTLTAGKTYRVSGQFHWLDAAVSGKTDFGGGSVTATGTGGFAFVTDDNGSTPFEIDALTGSFFGGLDGNAFVSFDFTIQVNAGGSLIPRFAQVTTDVGASTLLKYSTYTVTEVYPTPVY